MGVGVLAFPLAFKQAGYLFGTILTCVYGAIMTGTLIIIAKAAREQAAQLRPLRKRVGKDPDLDEPARPTDGGTCLCLPKTSTQTSSAFWAMRPTLLTLPMVEWSNWPFFWQSSTMRW